MRHVYECPMRWADLDMLGHVNNVVYVDYLQEARVDMLRTHGTDRGTEGLAGSVGEGVVVVRHDVTYAAPLTFRFEPVRIECWVTEIRAASFTVAYEVFDEVDGERTTYARATTVLTPYLFTEERPRRLTPEERHTLERFHEPGEPEPRQPWSKPRRIEGGHYPLRVRFSDVDVYGHVNNVKYYEFFQEARIPLLQSLGAGVMASTDAGVVVARTEVDYRVPIHFREQPYDVWSWFSHVGRRSATIEAEIRDGDTLLSRSRVVLVFFDAATQRSAEPPVALRERLLAALEA